MVDHIANSEIGRWPAAARRGKPPTIAVEDVHSTGPSTLSNSAILRASNVSPTKNRSETHNDSTTASPAASPRKTLAGARKGSIWDSFFQYDISYQGGKSKK